MDTLDTVQHNVAIVFLHQILHLATCSNSSRAQYSLLHDQYMRPGTFKVSLGADMHLTASNSMVGNTALPHLSTACRGNDEPLLTKLGFI